MGLAAGINFSLRSVALAGESYRRDEAEQLLKPDEILQMFGRAGRRGLDETGFVLVTPNELRLLDAHPGHLSRSSAVDWSALLGLMTVASEQEREPFREAVRAQERLFTTKPIVLGVEESLRHPETPCGLKTDSERARHVRKRVREFLNSRGEWEPMREWVGRPVREIVTPFEGAVSRTEQGRAEISGASRITPQVLPPTDVSSNTDPGVRPTIDGSPGPGTFQPILSISPALEKIGHGTLCVLSENEAGKTYGRALTVADRLGPERVLLAKWVRRLTNWNGRQVPLPVWNEQVVPSLERKLAEQKTPVVRFSDEDRRILAQVSIADLPMRVPVDAHGVAIWKPIE